MDVESSRDGLKKRVGVGRMDGALLGGAVMVGISCAEQRLGRGWAMAVVVVVIGGGGRLGVGAGLGGALVRVSVWGSLERPIASSAYICGIALLEREEGGGGKEEGGHIYIHKGRSQGSGGGGAWGGGVMGNHFHCETPDDVGVEKN